MNSYIYSRTNLISIRHTYWTQPKIYRPLTFAKLESKLIPAASFSTIDSFYSEIVSVLIISSSVYVPNRQIHFYKFWLDVWRAHRAFKELAVKQFNKF